MTGKRRIKSDSKFGISKYKNRLILHILVRREDGKSRIETCIENQGGNTEKWNIS